MKESTNIANRFSDAYIVAMLEGTSGDEVVRQYEASYPELQDAFRRNAKDLELLYGHLRKSQMPSDSEIARAYSTVRSRMPATAATPEPARAQAESFSSRIASFFKVRPAVAGVSFALTLAILVAVIWQPWMQKTPSPTAEGTGVGPTSTLPAPSTPSEIAEGPTTSKPTDIQGPTFRGGETGSQVDRGVLDKKDRTRLAKLRVDNTLTAPTGLNILAASDSVIVIRWNAVRNALTYIVETKRANEGEFKAVIQTNQTQARISGLPSSERMEIRVIAASGERKGEASAAKNITVP